MFYVDNIIEMRNRHLKENKISLKEFNNYNIDYLKEIISLNINKEQIKFKDKNNFTCPDNVRDNLILLLNDLKV
jgi:hypothetical protein